MAKVLLTVACIALLLAAAGLLLWQWAKGRQARQAASRHLDQQILASTAAAASLPIPLRDLPSDGLMADPWLETDASAAASEPVGLLEKAMPDWLIGVIEPRMAALGLVAIVVLAALAGLFGGWIAALSALTLLALLAVFAIWLRLQKFRRKLVSQLPTYIDAMVRLITIGNSTQAAFQLAIATTEAPLRGQLERAASLVRAGMDLDRALHQTASTVRVEEMFLLASILGLGVRYGGRSDLLLERVGNFMRDREQAEHELLAMSSETRLSAWILGLLPVSVGAFFILTNPSYFLGMWNDGTGRMMVLSAAGFQLFGAALLYRLAKLT
ncbi:type II secretion system F family protein [Variovorax paradoxus]|uniref:Bacterial type II secretion system protein F domain protein n=1 Tax=Variovorax paradoxus TaxID=34073 RepID=A0A0H2LX83_VARPD|nr:type II secretion system F family protein [Variovorax paradoxus]KLN54853.1 bacterial type II secretion system protein F domain protein [Variovorax paradoxus]